MLTTVSFQRRSRCCGIISLLIKSIRKFVWALSRFLTSDIQFCPNIQDHFENTALNYTADCWSRRSIKETCFTLIPFLMHKLSKCIRKCSFFPPASSCMKFRKPMFQQYFYKCLRSHHWALIVLNKLCKYKITSNVVAYCVETRGLVRIPAPCVVGGYSVPTWIASLQTQCKSYLESVLSCHFKLMIFFF